MMKWNIRKWNINEVEYDEDKKPSVMISYRASELVQQWILFL